MRAKPEAAHFLVRVQAAAALNNARAGPAYPEPDWFCRRGNSNAPLSGSSKQIG
jgi:hypothetical protein